MSGENKKTGTDNKIMSFQISEEEMQDPKLDSYVRESLIREADELEEELNRRPDLAAVKAPEGMYQSIVEELKARGVWEEDEACGDGAAAEDGIGRSAAGAGGIGAVQDTAAAQTGKEALEVLYAQLPEEDRKALELGRELVRKKETKAKKHRGRRKVFRIAGIAAACLVLVFGVSMTSEANRRLVQRMWDGLMIEFGFRVNTNYLGEKESVRSKSTEEVEAMEAISKRLGSPLIDFPYLPKGMKYEGYDISNRFEATLFYNYQDNLFYVTIMDMDEEGSHYYKYDNEAVYRETVETHAGIKVKIWEVNLDLEEETYIAELEYEDWRYVLNGIISIDVFRDILKGLIIL